jgi:hypothetical protein
VKPKPQVDTCFSRQRRTPRVWYVSGELRSLMYLFRNIFSPGIVFLWCVFTLGAGQVEMSQARSAISHSCVVTQEFQGTNVVGHVPRVTFIPNPVPLLFFHFAADKLSGTPAPSRLVATQYTVPCFATLRYYTRNLQLEGG